MGKGTQFVVDENKRFPVGFESTGKVFIGKGKVNVEVNPAVVIESSRFRNLLRNLGFKVKVWWKPRSVTKRGKVQESTRHELDYAEIEAGGKKNKVPLNSFPRRNRSKQEG
jgi:hypothetical protein